MNGRIIRSCRSTATFDIAKHFTSLGPAIFCDKKCDVVSPQQEFAFSVAFCSTASLFSKDALL